MTNESGVRPSPEQAQQALTAISDSQRALAPFVRSPRWLYPVQGIGMGLFVVGLVLFRSHGWASVALGASVIVFCALPILQSTRALVILDVYTHRGSRMTGLAYLAAFAVLVAGALILHAVTAADWIVYVTALLAFVLTLMCGQLMETRLARWMGRTSR